MTVILPGSPMYDVASSTTVFIAPFEPLIALAGGVFLALFVIEFLFIMLGNRYMHNATPPAHPPMM